MPFLKFNKEEDYWKKVSDVQEVALKLSQLDVLPPQFVKKTKELPSVFADIVSPVLTEKFLCRIENLMKDSDAIIKAGPSKTYARTLVKCEEYKEEAKQTMNHPRWRAFEEKFMEIYGQRSSTLGDYVFNVLDFARVSITVDSPEELLNTMDMIKGSFEVVCIKNGYSRNLSAKGSGYRDLKMIVEFEVENHFNGYRGESDGKVTFLCELQLLCKE